MLSIKTPQGQIQHVNQPTMDLNAATTAAFYEGTGVSLTNGPVGNTRTNFTLDVEIYDLVTINQMLWTHDGTWIRQSVNGSWGAWVNTLNNAAQNAVGGKLPYILPGGQSAVPRILPSSGTSNATGQITLTTALPYQPSGTCYIYLPAGVVTAGSQGSGAGMYAVTFSSTTVCQISGTGIVTASGGYTQTTSSGITLFSTTVQGGTLGLNGGLRAKFTLACPNNSNAKQMWWSFGSLVGLQTGGTTVASIGGEATIQNRGSQSAQRATPNHFGPLGGASNSLITGSVDTSQNQTFSLIGLIAVATDYAILDGYDLWVLPSA